MLKRNFGSAETSLISDLWFHWDKLLLFKNTPKKQLILKKSQSIKFRSLLLFTILIPPEYTAFLYSVIFKQFYVGLRENRCKSAHFFKSY